MRAYLTLVRRDLGGFFHSFTGYLVVTLVALLLGLAFFVLIEGLNQETMEIPLLEIFYDTFFFWLILLLASPVITMRSFAQEKFSGTYEALMTTPVGNVQLVLAKFTAVMIFYSIMWLPLGGCLWVVHHYSAEPPPFDPGQYLAMGIGIFLLGTLYMSLGCFASSLTRSQIVAAMITLTCGVSFFLLSFLPYLLPFQTGWTGTILTQISLMEHMRDFVRGVIDTREVLFYLSLTFLFLFLTVKMVELRQWK